jgi:hypothetical protein
MSTESNYSFTTKVNGDLFTLRGDDFASFIGRLGESSNVPAVQHLLDVLSGTVTITEQQAVANVTAAFNGTVTGAPAVAPVAPPVPPAIPPAAPPASNASAPVCNHGAMIGRKGNGAKGEWRGFFCPTPKGTPDQCSPKFAQRNTAEWNLIS